MRLFYLFLFIGTFSTAIAAPPNAATPVTLSPVQQNLTRHFQHKSLRFKKLRFTAYSNLKPLYESRDYQPIWSNHQGLSRLGHEFLTVLRDAANVGLSSQDYQLALLEARANTTPFTDVARADLEIIMSDAFLRYVDALRNGQMSPARLGRGDWRIHIDKPWDAQTLLNELLAHDLSLKSRLQTLAPQHLGYRRLQRALSYYRLYQSHNADWPQLGRGGLLKQGTRGKQVETLRARLLVSGDLQEDKSGEAATLFDAELQAAVKRFQARHGLTEDGVVGPATRAALNVPLADRIAQMRWNLERWRWLPETLPAHRILVNIPDFSLLVYEHHQPVDSMRVVVGRLDRKTPILQSEIRRLEFNPPWRVPRSITVKDILPNLYANPGYLSARNMIALYDNAQLNPHFVNWAEYHENNFPSRLRFEQAPGKGNALGKVKFVMPNCCNIYLHDTPTRHLFRRQTRAFSSGCIRVEHPQRLTEHLLLAQTGWKKANIQRAFKSSRQRGVKILQPVPVYLLYWTAWVDHNGIMQFRDDIYGYDRVMRRTLQR